MLKGWDVPMQEFGTSVALSADGKTVDSALQANILLVDDNPAKLLALESVLARLGENLLTARSADEALRYLLHQDFAVIVLDVNMPGMNGFELAELIRCRERLQHTPIIFISAISPTETHAFKGYELGAVDYIYTPTPEVLRAKVAVFVDLFKKTAEVKRYADALRLLNAQLEQRVAERTAALQQSNEELQQFVHMVSHDLKEPLRGMHNYADLLLAELGNTVHSEACGKLQTLTRLSQRMEDLINSLLHFCRLGQEHLTREDTDLNTVVQEVLRLLHITLTQQGADVRLPRLLPVVRCDRARVREVFHNLILNAIKYNDKSHKWVEISFFASAVKGDDHTEVRSGAGGTAPVYTFYVRDNGIGIRPQHTEQIFAMFKRLHPHDAYGQGTGAGLSIARRVLERHGGRSGLSRRTAKVPPFSLPCRGYDTRGWRDLHRAYS
jgi:signal transduction histidine kinase